MNLNSTNRQLLFHGLTLILAGLLWGLVVPATPFPRLALSAHIQFMVNGMLFVIMATMLIALPNAVGPRSLRVMVIAAWLTWAMALSEVANAWWGTHQTLPIAAAQAGATGAAPWQERIVTGAHVAAGLGLIVAWGLLITGFLRNARDTTSS